MKAICLFIGFSLSTMAWATSQPQPQNYNLQIFGCSVNRHLIRATFRLSNFSPYDMDLPNGYTWATANEHRRVASQIFGEEFMSEANSATDDMLRSQRFLEDVALKDVIVEDTDQNGRVIRGHTSLLTKIFIDIKKSLMSEGKYSGSSMNFSMSSIEVDSNSDCAF